MLPKLLAPSIWTFLVLVVAGCGSGGSSSGSLSVGAFVSQGNEICREAAKQRQNILRSAVAEGHEANSDADLSSLVDLALEPIEEMVGRLRDLKPPRSRRNQAEAFVDDLNMEIEKLRRAPTRPVSKSSFKLA